ncbi:MAG: tRNA uridine-5-carboxymethylaminomethyl(34) synthesis GTPase MnmE [Oscillospiraceae bacterium]|nr:tRNA uridine-5-carboxymethylaminomethyl(34) synthesis GTPase MnmE [Oscillospiraceae bacterium]
MSTIAAIATAQAAAGLGTIKISGEAALSIADKVFNAVSGKKLSDAKGYTAFYGKVHDGETTLDDAVALVFRAPKSYTGEDVVELSCHGGLFILRRVLRAVLNAGADAAEGGEFTKRAFLNGKMDLSEAEAVMSLISASGEEARAATLNALDGALSREIGECREELAKTSSFLAAWVDYPDDEIPELTDSQMQETLSSVRNRLSKLLYGFDAGRAILEGVDTAIVGRPNVGKSTLMNALSGRERAIVTSVAGTTRDVLEETVRLGNITLRLADTAGIRMNTDDEIEKIGVLKAKERFDRASLVLMVLEFNKELSNDDKELLELCKGKNSVVVINKADEEQKLSLEEVKKLFGNENIVLISAKKRDGLEDLTKTVEKVVGTARFDPSAPLITTERQRSCTNKALQSLDEALDGLAMGITPDAINVCIDCAVENLCVLTGEKATETVVNEVFKNFCVGK